MFVNKQEMEVLRTILLHGARNQRQLAEQSGHSLGVVNRSVKTLIAEGYLSEGLEPTGAARAAYQACAPKNAIILAAGFGMRMVPINLAAPKAMLEVHGEPLIERQIRQLQEAGVKDITIVVGFMKERFEYLMDEYQVKLAVNAAYAERNNLSSLALVAGQIGNTFILPSDLWCEENPFTEHELYSWYMVSDEADPESPVRVNRRMELATVQDRAGGNRMIGIAWVTEKDAEALRKRLREMNASDEHKEDFWEAALMRNGRMSLAARIVSGKKVVEINTYEQLRELDGESNHLKHDALDVIAEVFRVSPDQITDITVLKKGMTNRSFLFSVRGEKYIMRIPGEGTSRLINRQQEAAVFRAISGRGLCDDPVYLNPENGYKITRYLEGVRVCDVADKGDLSRCMEKLRTFHRMRLRVDHAFDLFGQIDFYESLWKGQPCLYADYRATREKVLSLKEYIDRQEKDCCLTHIDAVPDNFLFHTLADGSEGLQLTDWEYAGMQDPHVDLAMFCVYSFFDRAQCDELIDLYFEGKCPADVRTKIYCYIAASGLLWSNWCEYKRTLGVEFGDYSLRQYRYAKDFYRFATAEMEKGS